MDRHNEAPRIDIPPPNPTQPLAGALLRQFKSCLSIRLPSTQSLVLITLGLVVVAGGLRLGLPIYLRESSLKEVQALGGKFSTTDDFPPVPAEFGDSWFDSGVRVIRLNGSRITDSDMVHFKWLTRVQDLFLDHTPIGDAGLSYLEGLTNLGGLFLDGTQITDAGLAHLSRLENLQFLSLRETDVTDAGLAHLQSLARLHHLSISSTQVTNKKLVHFQSPRSPRTTEPHQPEITDAGIADLKRSLPNLQIDVYR